MLLSLLTSENLASTSDLTTVANVRRYLQTLEEDTGQDMLIQQLITRASRMIVIWTGREFAPSSGPVARTFLYTGGSVIDLAPFELRSATSIIFDSNLTAGAQTTLTDDDYYLEPVNTRDGVYQYLTVGPLIGRAPASPRRVTITGYWGWSVVPPDVEQAAIITVREWLRPVSAFNRPFTTDAPPERPVSLPYAAQDILSMYRTPVIA